MPSSKRRSSSSSLFSFACGCHDSKSVWVSSSDISGKSAAAKARTQRSVTTATESAAHADDRDSVALTFSGLLRQLGELEQSVMEWAPRIDAGGRRGRDDQRKRRGEAGRVGESVAVVKESEDPLEDFRRSMLQMIVENEIVDGVALRHLLRRFLHLNSPRYHDDILRAFAEIWSEVFLGREDTPAGSLRL